MSSPILTSDEDQEELSPVTIEDSGDEQSEDADFINDSDTPDDPSIRTGSGSGSGSELITASDAYDDETESMSNSSDVTEDMELLGSPSPSSTEPELLGDVIQIDDDSGDETEDESASRPASPAPPARTPVADSSPAHHSSPGSQTSVQRQFVPFHRRETPLEQLTSSGPSTSAGVSSSGVGANALPATTSTGASSSTGDGTLRPDQDASSAMALPTLFVPEPEISVATITIESESNVTGTISGQSTAAPVPATEMLPSTVADQVPPIVLSAVSEARLNTSATEFRSPAKRRRISSPEKKTSALPEPEVDEEAECCTICFEPWTNSGKHRLASLKCGHIFGQSCIERWLKGQGGKCPQCNSKATKKDIRVIYAKALRTLDTSERDRALQDLTKERETRQKAELDAAQSRLLYQKALDDCKRLRQELERLKELNRHNPGAMHSISGSQMSASQLPPSAGQYIFDRIIKIWDGGNCRVMAYTHHLASLVVSQPSASPLFPGFGVKKISALDFKSSQYISLHAKPIRDMCFNSHQGDGLLLSVSMDKTVKMTSLMGNTTVNTHKCPMPIWSCSWNHDDKNYYYAGMQNGTVCVFDIRNTSEMVNQLNTEGARSPVVSLQYVAANPNAAFRPGGLLVSQLTCATFYEARPGGEFRPHAFPLDGFVTYMSVEESTRHLLTTYRPSNQHPMVRHQVSALSNQGCLVSGTSTCQADHIHTFNAGNMQKLLSRSRLIVPPMNENKMLACAADEVSNNVQTWDVGSGQLVQKLPCQAPVIDLCPIDINNKHYLAALTERQVHLFRWQAAS